MEMETLLRFNPKRSRMQTLLHYLPEDEPKESVK